MKISNGLVVGVQLLALLILPAHSALAAGRDLYRWDKTAKEITFNSVTNNPAIGDERYFLMSRNYNDNNYSDQLSVLDNEEVVLKAYYHNDAAANKIAKNTRVQIKLPSGGNKIGYATAYISSDNSQPKAVVDTTKLVSDQPFKVEYVPGSAQIWNNVLRGTQLNDSIVTSSGALIGYDKLDGRVQGGSLYSGYITLRVKVNIAKTVTSKGSVGVVNGVPNTGPGEVIGLFAGASAIGTAAHMVVSRRNRR